MKKTTKTAKRILSMLLAISIVLSFALTSVSALPQDHVVVDEKYDVNDFSDGRNTIFNKGTIVTDGEAYSGDHSLAIATSLSGSTKFIKLWPKTSNFAYEAGGKYHLSFKFYDPGFGKVSETAWNKTGWTINNYNTVDAGNGWKMFYMHFTVDAYHATSTAIFDFAIALWGATVDTVYFDDVELAKVESFEQITNKVPVGAVVEESVVRSFDDGSTKSTFTVANGDATVGISGAYSYGGDVSFAITGKEGNTSNPSIYIASDLGFSATLAPDRKFPAGKYYVSYYVYTDGEGVSSYLMTNTGMSITAPAELVPGQWTKVAASFDISETQAAVANSGLFRMYFNGIGENAVYLDEMLLAKISAVNPVEMYAESMSYNSADNTATVNIKSTVALKAALASAPEGVDVGDVTVSEDGTSIAVELSGLTTNTQYELTMEVSDVFGGITADSIVSFTTPMTIKAASIANGATDVVAPVDYIYIETPSPVEEMTLSADKFAIEGLNASVTAVSLVDGKIKVELDGICPSESYKLTVDGVESTTGAVLNDSISFTTRASDRGIFNDFESVDYDEEAGKYPTPEQFPTANSGISSEVTTEKAYSGEKSLILNPHSTQTYWGGYSGMWINGMKATKTYVVSFYYYSDTWNTNNNGDPLISPSYGTLHGDPVFSSTEASQWNKVTFLYTPSAGYGGALLQLRQVGQYADGGCIYFDDIRIKEVGTICNPVILTEGSVANTITAGTTNISVPVVDGTAGILAYAVQYDADGKMISAAAGTATETSIDFILADAQAVKTKLIFVNAETLVAICAPIQYN